MTARGPDVMGQQEVAATLGISPQRVGQLRHAGKLPPCTELAQGRVWDGPDIRALAKDRNRPDPAHARVLQSYRKTKSVTRAAEAGRVHPTTARRYLHDLGVL